MITQPDFMDFVRFEEPGHRYFYRDKPVPSITQICPHPDFSGIPPQVFARKTQIGHAAHSATELYDKHLLDFSTLNPVVEPYLESWVKARQLLDIQFEDDDIERILFHPVYNYAGRGDRPRCIVEGELSTLEIKTIFTVGPEVAIQTAGQQLAENYRCKILGIPETGPRWAIQLQKDGRFLKKHAHKYTEKHDHTVFLSYLHTRNWEAKHYDKTRQLVAA